MKIPNKIEKKNQKIKKPLFGFISSQNGDEIDRVSENKNFSPELRSCSTMGKKFGKK